MELYTDEYFMREALKEANKALEIGEVPVGAVVVCMNRIIARAHNQTEKLTDATAHAEMIAVTAASNHLGSKYLNECTLYVTLEPCVMCAGALIQARVARLVYGARDERAGAVESRFRVCDTDFLNHRIEVTAGVLEQECREVMQDFFRTRREARRKDEG